MAFAPRTVSSLVPGGDGVPPRMEVFFFGLFGPHGPLPLHLTEYARNRLRQAGDPTFARFADIFHHRLLSLFYRAWANAQPTVNLDRPESDRFADYVGGAHRTGDARHAAARFAPRSLQAALCRAAGLRRQASRGPAGDDRRVLRAAGGNRRVRRSLDGDPGKLPLRAGRSGRGDGGETPVWGRGREEPPAGTFPPSAAPCRAPCTHGRGRCWACRRRSASSSGTANRRFGS